MSTPTLTSAATVASVTDVADVLVSHLRSHGLPEPASVGISAGNTVLGESPELRLQPHYDGMPAVARLLLAWAETLPSVAVAVWRVPRGESAHVEITSSLHAPSGPVRLCVYAGMRYDPTVLPTLAPGETHAVPLGLLRTLTVKGGEAA